MTRYNVKSFLRAGLIMSLALSLMAVASFTNPALLSNALEKNKSR